MAFQFGKFGQDFYQAAGKIAANMKPGEEITSTLVNKARKNAYSGGVSQLSKELMGQAEEYAKITNLKNGVFKKPYDSFMSAAGGITRENMDENIDVMRGILNKAKSQKSERFLNSFKENTVKGLDDIEELSSGINSKTVQDYYIKQNHGRSESDPYSILGMANYAKDTAGAYFNPADNKALGKTRRRVAAGAYVGGSVGLRYLRGGSLTQDPYGERDIAGVPFI